MLRHVGRDLARTRSEDVDGQRLPGGHDRPPLSLAATADPHARAGGAQGRAPAVEAAASSGQRSVTGSGCLPRRFKRYWCRLMLTHLDRATGADPPSRPPEHGRPDPPRRQEARQGPLRRLPLRRTRQDARAALRVRQARNRWHNALIGTYCLHAVIDDYSVSPTSRPRRRDRKPPAKSCATRSPGWSNVASPSVASCTTTAVATSHSCGATPAPTSQSRRRRPGTTAPTGSAATRGQTATPPHSDRLTSIPSVAGTMARATSGPTAARDRPSTSGPMIDVPLPAIDHELHRA